MHLQSLAAPKAPSFSIWKRDFVLSKPMASGTLTEKRALIPAAERAIFPATFPFAERNWRRRHSEGAYGPGSHPFPGSSRATVPYRARATVGIRAEQQIHRMESPATFKSAHETMGLYSFAAHARCGLRTCRERDPIWVEDFLELYDTLEKLSSASLPVEKKRNRISVRQFISGFSRNKKSPGLRRRPWVW